MSLEQPLKCPVCHKTLFTGIWVASALSITIHCRCKRVIRIREDATVSILSERQPEPYGSKRN